VKVDKPCKYITIANRQLVEAVTHNKDYMTMLLSIRTYNRINKENY